MGASGSTTVNFGAFPGDGIATVAITGQSGILSGSKCEAFLDPTQPDTVDHLSDEHLVADIDIRCNALVAGTGFTINAVSRGGLQYGQWNVSWVWA
jgi:hypothetical protein